MIVVDTNIIAYYCLPGPFTTAAIQLSRDEPEWRAPSLWRSEMQNVLITKMRSTDLQFALALQAMEDAEIQMQRRRDCVSTASVLALAASGCTAYDLEFVALAQALRAPLYTMDRQVLRAFPGLARALMPEAES
jgi:predicted nucleic acid-binding protein